MEQDHSPADVHTPSNAYQMETATITDDMIERMKSKVGLELKIDGSRNNAEATRFSIIRFAEGMGDDNPLFTDEQYAGTSRLGTLVAPPTWVFCCFAGIQFGWPGLGSVHSASELTLNRLVRVGDVIDVRCVYDGFEGPVPSSFAGQKILETFRVEYTNQRDELVATHLLTITRFERGQAQARTQERELVLPHPWTDEELEDIDEAILAEAPLGGTTRYWDDVEVGDRLAGVTRGPIGITDEVAYVSTGAAPIPRIAANRAALKKYRKQPKWAFRDPSTHAWEPLYSVHYNEFAAKQMGANAPYDVGPQRMSWQVTMLTDWAGDWSFVKRVTDAFRGFVYLSDVVRLRGQITDKYMDDDGDAVVEIETSAMNQRGENVMPGSAVVALPTRSGSDPLHERM